MQWEEAQQSWVILYPEGMVRLNETAAETLRRCDGKTPLKSVIADLEAEYGEADLTADVQELIDAALQQGWISRR
jgi:pyrroloquinoline quinone biosynthesis protein D